MAGIAEVLKFIPGHKYRRPDFRKLTGSDRFPVFGFLRIAIGFLWGGNVIAVCFKKADGVLDVFHD